MSSLKVSTLFNFSDWSSSTLVKLFHSLSKKKIEYVDPKMADILFIGPYDINSIKRRVVNSLLKKLNITQFPNIDIYSLKRNYNPIRVFFSFENYRYESIKADYFITPDLGVTNNNHLRFPFWKDCIDWSSSEGIFRNHNTLNALRFGSYWDLNKLLNPFGEDFLKKKKEFCIISSHLTEPKKSIYLKFSQHFKVDGYGPYFNKRISNHNSSDFKIYDVLKNYSFNLCPHNSLYPGYYDEKIVNAFVSKSLPITWADQNINIDFNDKAFINLIDYSSSNYEEICSLIKDENFLRKFSKEPLLLNKPDLEKEKSFVLKILSNF